MKMLKIIFISTYIDINFMNNNYFDFDIIGLKMCIFIFYCVSLFVFYGVDYTKCINDVLQKDIEIDNNIQETNVIPTENAKNTNKSKQTIQIPYEEKYLSHVRSMINEYIFTQEELQLESQKFLELIENEKTKIINSIGEINDNINELNVKLNDLNDVKIKEINKDETLLKKIKESITNELNLNNLKLIELQNNKIDEETIKKQAREFVIDEQLKKFKNCFVIEATPLGSVLMFYNHNKLAFEYYSDLTIPYRFLETVARKYVLTYKYRPLYIDMEEELKEYERKLKEQEDLLKEKEEMRSNDKNESNEEHKDVKSNKKNVFAKFKSYNKEAGTGRVNTAPAPKNNIPQNMMSMKLIDTKKNGDGKTEKMLLKERSNRYSYQGKFSNFNILQKIDKKKVNKKLSITFADFKKLNQSNKN